MKLANGFLTITFAAVLTGLPAQAQAPAPGAKPETEVRTFYLNNVVQGDQAGNEILNALRVSLDSHDSFFLDNYLEAIVLAAFGASRRTPRNFNFEIVLTFFPAPSSYQHLKHRSS
jgi:hypothetical protein